MKKHIAALAATILAVGALALGVTPASAHTASASVTCTTWQVDASSYEPGATGTVIVDGITEFGPARDMQGGGSLSGTFADAEVEHRLQVTIDSTDGDGTEYDFSYDVTTDGCEPEVVVPPVEPEVPVVVPQVQDYVGDCDAAFVLDNTGSTLPVVYTVNGLRFLVEAGTAVHTDADGTRIEPVDGGYTITTDTGREWYFEAGDCPVVEEPPVVTEPPVATEPPVVTPEPSEPVVTPVPEPETELIPPTSGSVEPEVVIARYEAPAPTEQAQPTAAPATLPQTGFDGAPALGIVALLLLLLGVSTMLIRRTRNQQ